ncbi:MAG: nuclear transport factor 2 family protein [Deltaproteobacteria bacterium]|nr:nuclear transport factor 2 family protein [Deltaproteobacteria bacterium]
MSETISREERNTRTAIQYLQHIVDGSGKYGKASFDKAFALVSDDFEIEVLPGSVEMPRMGLPRYRKWLEPMVAELFDDFTMKILETTAQDNRVAIEATSSARTKDGRPYGMEYRISFQFNDQGKITRVKEYVDSLFTARFYGLIREK